MPKLIFPRVRWPSLRLKIIAWSFIPTTIILLAVALVTFGAYARVTEDLVFGRDQELARLSASQLAAELSEYSGILAALARTGDIYKGDPAAQREGLKRAANRLVVFDAGVVVLDTRGVVVAADPERPDSMGQDWSNRAYYRQMFRSAAPAFSDVVADGPRGTEVVVVAVPITSDQGEFQGTLAGMFRLGAPTVSAFYGSIVKLRVGGNGQAYLVDSNGRIIYHSDADRIGETLPRTGVIEQVLGGKVGAATTHELGGDESIVASYAPVPGTQWGLVSEESWDSLLGPSRGYRYFLLLLLALGVVVPTAVVLVGIRRITHPIAELIEAAREVAGGNFGRTIRAQTGDEIEEMARQFNRMSSELQESYAQLERRVADRTRELATLNTIAAVVSQSLDLEEILQAALDKTLEVMGVDAGGAYLLDRKEQMLVLRAHRGFSEEFVREADRVPLHSSASALALGEGRPIAVQVADYPDGSVKDLLRREGLVLVVSIPLIAKGSMLGAINLGTRALRTTTPEELSLLAAIGQQIGVAVENARLYEHAEEAAVAAERNRLARDLHDAVTQTLFSASLIAEVLPRLWERNPDEGRRRLEELRQLTRGALAEMRTLLLELRPTALTEAPLGNLLRHLAEATTGRARIPVSLTVEGGRPLPPDAQVALYRIAQEALNNVAKHSGANQASVSVRFDASEVRLSISDDGRGFDPSQVPPDHLGLGIIRERAQAIGATVEIESAPGEGTQVIVVWKDRTEG